jgi:hypothetical protein
MRILNFSQLSKTLKQNSPIVVLCDIPNLRKPEEIDVGYGHFIVLLKEINRKFIIWDPDKDLGGYFLISSFNLENSRSFTDKTVFILMD